MIAFNARMREASWVDVRWRRSSGQAREGPGMRRGAARDRMKPAGDGAGGDDGSQAPRPSAAWHSLDGVDLREDRRRVDFLRIGLLHRLGEFEQPGALGEREGLELALLLQLGEQTGITRGLGVATELARFLAGLEDGRLQV